MQRLIVWAILRTPCLGHSYITFPFYVYFGLECQSNLETDKLRGDDLNSRPAALCREGHSIKNPRVKAPFKQWPQNYEHGIQSCQDKDTTKSLRYHFVSGLTEHCFSLFPTKYLAIYSLLYRLSYITVLAHAICSYFFVVSLLRRQS